MIEPEITTILGTTGCGKTTLLYGFLKDAQRHIVMTTKPSGFKAGWIQCESMASLKDVLLKKYHHKRLKICLRLVVGPREADKPIEAMNQMADLLFAVQKMALRKGVLKPIGLTVDEAQRFAPGYGNQNGIKWLVGEGREWRVYLTFATQRPTNIPPVIRDNSKNLYVLFLGGDTAVTTIRKLIGPKFKPPKQFDYDLYREGSLVDSGNTRSPKKLIHFA